MKLLENTAFESVIAFIDDNTIDFPMDVRLESYSCKMVSTDKKEWRKNIQCPNAKPQDLQPLSPAVEDSLGPFLQPLSVSPAGSSRLRHLSEAASIGSGSDNDVEESAVGGGILVEAVSRRALFNMVALLNLSYTDYDFSQTRSESFARVSAQDCMRSVDDKFTATISDYSKVREQIWKVIDEEIRLNECHIYRYIPGYTGGDPFTEDGCIWSFNYLVYNKSLKRILFFACRALRRQEQNLQNLSADQLWGVDVEG